MLKEYLRGTFHQVGPGDSLPWGDCCEKVAWILFLWITMSNTNCLFVRVSFLIPKAVSPMTSKMISVSCGLRNLKLEACWWKHTFGNPLWIKYEYSIKGSLRVLRLSLKTWERIGGEKVEEESYDMERGVFLDGFSARAFLSRDHHHNGVLYLLHNF